MRLCDEIPKIVGIWYVAYWNLPGNAGLDCESWYNKPDGTIVKEDGCRSVPVYVEDYEGLEIKFLVKE